MKKFHFALLRALALVLLVSLALALDANSPRVESLAKKLRCTCGCGDILQECSHAKCDARGSLKRELADALQQGQTDAQILEQMGIRHGAAILLTPPLKGFNSMLWIMPIAVAVFGLAFVVLGRLRG